VRAWWEWHEKWLAWLAYNLAWQPKGHLIWNDLLHSTYVAPWAFLTQPTISAAWWRTRSYAWIVGHLRNGRDDSQQALVTIGFAHFVEGPLALFVVLVLLWAARRLTRFTPLPTEALSKAPFRVKLRQARHEKRDKDRIAVVLLADERAQALRDQTKELAAAGWFNARGWPVGTLYGTRKMVYIPPSAQTSHVSVVGGTGAGKTAAQLINYAHHEADMPDRDRHSGLYFDPKAGFEITRLTAGLYRRRGWRVGVWDPTRPGSLRYNSLAYARGAGQVRAHMLQWAGAANLRHPHYREQAADILTGVALMLRADAEAAAAGRWATITMGDVAAFIDEQTEEEAVEILSAHAARSSEPALRRTASKLRRLQSNKVSREAIMRGVNDCLVCLDDPQVRDSLKGQDIDPRAFVDRPTIIYAALDMDSAHALRPIVATLLTSFVTELTRVAAGKRLKRRVVLAFDEFANIGQIDQMEHIASVVRALGIALLLLTQGPRDVLDVYGRQGRRLLANILTTVVLARTPIESLKFFVEPDLDLDLKRLMERGTAVVIRSGEAPIRIKTRGWYTSRWQRVVVWGLARRVNKETLLAAQARGVHRGLGASTAATAEDAVDAGGATRGGGGDAGENRVAWAGALAPTVPLTRDAAVDAAEVDGVDNDERDEREEEDDDVGRDGDGPEDGGDMDPGEMGVAAGGDRAPLDLSPW